MNPYRPSNLVARALRDLGLFASDTMPATAWAAASVVAASTCRSRYERAAREALCAALASEDVAAAERAAAVLCDEGALMVAVAAEVRAEYEAKRDAEKLADAAHAAEVARRRAAVSIAPAVEAPAAKAARRDCSCANPRCRALHQNTALCDDCASKVALPCPYDGIEGCDCLGCTVAARACGELACAGRDINVYSLPEVAAARVAVVPTTPAALAPKATRKARTPRAYASDARFAASLDAETLRRQAAWGAVFGTGTAGCDACRYPVTACACASAQMAVA